MLVRSVVLMLVVACGRLGFDSVPGDNLSTDLIVTIADDRMAGPLTMSSRAELAPGTVGLSLREALAIASHRAGADAIGFDARSFAGGTATIAISSELVIGDAGTTIDATNLTATVAGAPGYAGTLLHVTGNGAIIDGLALQGGGIAVQADAVADLAVRHATIRDSAGEAIRIDGCTGVTIADSRIENAAGDPVLVRATSDAHVQRNFIALRTKSGSLHGVSFESVNRSQIIDNTIDPGTARLISLTDSSDNEIVGNILDRGDVGVILLGTSNNNLVFRNVVISPVDDSVYVDTGASDNRIVNNTFYLAPDVADNGTFSLQGNNLISSQSSDFAHSLGYDFHLMPGVPAIDTAYDLGLDMLPDQPERFLGRGPDMGAVESY